MSANIILYLAMFMLQSTVLIFIGLLIAKSFGRNRAAIRQIVYRCTFAAVLACPLISLCFPKFDGAAIAIYFPESETPITAIPNTALQTDVKPVIAETPETFSLFDLQEANTIAPIELQQPYAALPKQTVAATDSVESQTFSFRRATTAFLVFWSIGGLFFLARIVISRWRSFALLRHAVSVDDSLETRLQLITQRLRIRQRVRLLQNPFLSSPCLLGIRKPMLLLPDRIPENDREIDAILVHELAHLLRHDIAWLLAMRLACAVLFFQPLLLLLKRQMRQTSEEICDDEVLRFGVDSGAYAEQLLHVASNYVPGESLPDCVLSMASRKSRLRNRIERILDSSRIISVAVSRKTLVLTVAIAAMLTLITGSFSLEAGKNEPDNASELATKTPSESEIESVCRVVDSEGQPIPGAKVIVQLLPEKSTSRPIREEVLAEYRLTTDLQGFYRFIVTDEQAANPELQLHIAAAHPDYISTGFIFEKYQTFSDSYRLADNEQRTSITLNKSAKVTGTVLTPDGQPAASVLVYASSGEYSVPQTHTRTDSQGRFTIGTMPGKDRLLYVLPDDFAAISLVLKEDDADLGTMQLQNGVVLEGRAVDCEGKPVADVWLSLLLRDSLCVRRHGHDASCRAAVTDAEGCFRFRPVTPGDYVIETGLLMEYDRDDRELAPESAYVNLAFPEFWLGREVEKETLPPKNDSIPFAEMAITLTDQPVQQVEYRGMETVDIGIAVIGDIAKTYPSPTWIVSGIYEGFYWSEHLKAKKNDDNRLVLTVPAGLKNAYLMFPHETENRYYPLKYRFSQNETWSNNWYATLGNIEKDTKLSIEAQPYEPGMIRVAALNPDGKPLSRTSVLVQYMHVQFEDPKIITRNGDTIYTGIERRSPEVEFDVMDGQQVMWWYWPVLADVEFELSVGGYDEHQRRRFEPVKQTLTLKSGETREIIVPLKETTASNRESDTTSQ